MIVSQSLIAFLLSSLFFARFSTLHKPRVCKLYRFFLLISRGIQQLERIQQPKSNREMNCKRVERVFKSEQVVIRKIAEMVMENVKLIQ